MSIRAMTAVGDYSEARGNARVVMLFLADHADDYGIAYPGIERLAFKSRCTDRTVYRVLRQMAKAGELVILNRRGTSNVYLIRLLGLLPLDDAGRSRLGALGVPPDKLSPLTSMNANVTRTVSNTRTKEPRTKVVKGLKSSKDISSREAS